MNSPEGSVFTTVDFTDVIENSIAGVIPSGLKEAGVIRRVMRGIYDTTQVSAAWSYVSDAPMTIPQ